LAQAPAAGGRRVVLRPLSTTRKTPPRVAHAPSNVKDAAAGKSFIFMTIVVRNAMGTLLRVPPALVATPGCVVKSVDSVIMRFFGVELLLPLAPVMRCHAADWPVQARPIRRRAPLAASTPRYWASSKIEKPLRSELAKKILPAGFSHRSLCSENRNPGEGRAMA
jgi:hypothetical protein